MLTPGSPPEEGLGLPPPAPKELICPITQELMVDPVFAEDGFSYERIAMERWFSTGNRRRRVEILDTAHPRNEHLQVNDGRQ